MKGSGPDRIITGKSRRILATAGLFIVLGVAGLVVFRLSGSTLAPGATAIRGSWSWNDSSIFEFQRIDFRFTADSFFLAQRFIDPRKPGVFMPCSQADHSIYAAGSYFLVRDTLAFRGNFTDSRFSRDTLHLCRDTGFNAKSHYAFKDGSLCLTAPGIGKGVCLRKEKMGIPRP